MRKGIIFTIIAAVVSGWAVFINKFALVNWSNSEVYTSQKNIITALILTVVFVGWIYRKRIISLSIGEWGKLLIIGLIGGALPFVLFFKGLSLATSSSAAFFHKTLFIWVAILALPILKEKLSKIQLFAFAILVIGNISLFFPKTLFFGMAEILIILATIVWALENVLAKKFMKSIPAPIMAWGRMFFGSIILIGYLFIIGQGFGLTNISLFQLPWLLLVGITLFLFVTFWYGGLRRIPVVIAASILTIASPITTLLNSLYQGTTLPLNFWPIFALILLGLTILISNFLRSKHNKYAKKSIS